MPASGSSPGIVLGRDAHHDAGVGVALVARILAHAVGDHASGLGRRRHHRAAGTHAEAVHRAAVFRVVHQFVVGRAEQRIAGVRPEPRTVDQRLRVLDAKADGKRLGFHVDAARVQHLEGIACAVAEREDDMMAAERLAAGERHAADLLCHRGRPRSARRSRAAGSGSRRPVPRSRGASSRPCRPGGRCRCAASTHRGFLPARPP